MHPTAAPASTTLPSSLPSFSEGFGFSSASQQQPAYQAQPVASAQPTNPLPVYQSNLAYVYTPEPFSTPMCVGRPPGASSIYSTPPMPVSHSWSAHELPLPPRSVGGPYGSNIYSPQAEPAPAQSTAATPAHATAGSTLSSPEAFVNPNHVSTHSSPVYTSPQRTTMGYDHQDYLPASAEDGEWLPMSCSLYYPSSHASSSSPPQPDQPQLGPAPLTSRHALSSPTHHSSTFSRPSHSHSHSHARDMRDGLKRFACPYVDCTLKFARLNDQQRHSRIHSGESPFPCRRCGQRFKRSDARRRHEMKEVC